MQKQLNHYEFKEQQKTHKTHLIFILENLEHAENIGSAFRLADAFNIEKIYIVTTGNLSFEKINKTARSCQNVVEFEICNNIQDIIYKLQKQNYSIYNLEITSTSLPLREVDFSNKKIALIAGNEKHGVSEKSLSLVDDSIHIDMYGNNSSMNVITALSIATYKISEDQYKKGE